MRVRFWEVLIELWRPIYFRSGPFPERAHGWRCRVWVWLYIKREQSKWGTK